MRVLFIPAAVPSHLFPMVPLAWAFRSAGHEVYIAGQPPVVDSIVGAGLNAIPVGASYDLMANITAAGEAVRRETGEGPTASGDVSAMSPEAFRRYAELRVEPHVRTAFAMVDELVTFVRAWRPDLVVSDPITMVAPLVAAVAGAPLVHHLWGPQPATLTDFPGYGADPESWPGQLRELYGRFGVEPAAHHGVGTVDPGPPSLQPARVPRRLAARYLPFNGSASVPDWLRVPADRPRVCLSWLTLNTVSHESGAAHPLTALIGSLSTLGVETVVAVRAADRERIGPVPDGVRVVVDLPLNAVLPTCAAAVNHGGTGTTLTAAYYGVPQVVVPYNPGLTFNARLLTGAGAALTLPADPIDADDVAAAVSSLLGDSPVRKAAAELQAENLAQPAPSQVLKSIEELV